MQFAGVITLSMLTPSWDPIIGTLGGVLDQKWSSHVSIPSGVEDRDTLLLARTQMWFSKPMLIQNAKTAMGQATSKQNVGLKAEVKRDNTPKDLGGGTTHEPPMPSTQSWTPR